MKVVRLENFVGGWFVGDFIPSVLRTKDFEVSIKHFAAGDVEPFHHQAQATELTAIIDGRCRMAERTLSAGDIVVIEPLETVDFEALTAVALVAIKFPSLTEDKVLGFPEES